MAADKVYQLPYDEEIDKDIHQWLNSLPRSRKAELVRNALRFYINATQGGANVITVNPSPLLQVETPEKNTKKKRPDSLPTDGNF